MSKVEVKAGICGFTTIVNAEDKGNYTASFSLESECFNWKEVNDLLGGKTLNMMTELFKDKKTGAYNSEVLNVSLQTIPHISCPVISGVLKALETSVGLALPKDSSISFK